MEGLPNTRQMLSPLSHQALEQYTILILHKSILHYNTTPTSKGNDQHNLCGFNSLHNPLNTEVRILPVYNFLLQPPPVVLTTNCTTSFIGVHVYYRNTTQHYSYYYHQLYYLLYRYTCILQEHHTLMQHYSYY